MVEKEMVFGIIKYLTSCQNMMKKRVDVIASAAVSVESCEGEE